MLGTIQRSKRVGMYAVLAAFGFLLQAQKPATEAETVALSGEKTVRGQIVVLEFRGDDVRRDVRLRAFRQVLQRAERERAAAVVMRVNTSAGYVAEQAGFLLSEMAGMKVPVYVYVDPSALGMGALLALVSREVYLAPGAVIGGATPDAPEGKDKEVSGLTLSVLKAQVRSLAMAKGRSARVVEAMIDPEAALGGRSAPVATEGKPGQEPAKSREVLTLTAEEAIRAYQGEAPLAQGLASSVEDVVRQAKLPGAVVRLSREDWGAGPGSGLPGDLPGAGASRKTAAGETGEKGPEEGRARGGYREGYTGKIVVLDVGEDDLLSQARFEFMERVLERARKEKPSAVILNMNTPGGVAWRTSQLILKPFQNLPFPTYTYVNPHAESAGALLAIATDHIYMYPTSTIGSALVVQSTGEDLPESMRQKVEAMLRSEIRNVALAKGHNPDVAEAFVTSQTELVLDGVVISRRGEVLNLNAREATQIFDGKPLLAKGIAESIEDLIRKEGLQGQMVEVHPRGLEAFAEWVQLASVLLIAIGLAGAYMELNSPGFGVPGILSVLAFSLFFFGNYLAGNLVGYGTAVVFVLGFILLVLEFLVIPGTFFAGTVGVLLMLGALGAALVDRVEFESFAQGGESAPTMLAVFQAPLVTLALALVLAIGLMLLLMRFFPAVGPFRGLVLEGAVPGGTSLRGAVAGSVELAQGAAHALEGKEGVAMTDLRPGGKVRIGDQLYDVTTESEFLPREGIVRVIRVRGDRIIVGRAGQG